MLDFVIEIIFFFFSFEFDDKPEAIEIVVDLAVIQQPYDDFSDVMLEIDRWYLVGICIDENDRSYLNWIHWVTGKIRKIIK